MLPGWDGAQCVRKNGADSALQKPEAYYIYHSTMIWSQCKLTSHLHTGYFFMRMTIILYIGCEVYTFCI